MTWEEAARRIAAGEEVEHVLDIRDAEDRADFRAYLATIAPPEAVARHDARLRDLDTGITGARAAWHSISPAQRRALAEAVAGRQPACRIATLRNLASRDLVAWDGGAFTPEARVAPTERGLFVLRHGPVGEREGDGRDG